MEWVLGIIGLSLMAAGLWVVRTFYQVPPPPVEPPKPVDPPQGEILPVEKSLAEKLYDASYSCLGKELTPKDEVPDIVACVHNLEMVWHKTTGSYFGGKKPLTYTPDLFKVLNESPHFKRVQHPLKGAIVISPTEGDTIGHCGVMGKTHIMSHNSFNGRWEANYTPATWQYRYGFTMGLNVAYFVPIR